MRRRRIYALVAGLAAVAAVALMLAFVVIPGGAANMKSPEASTQEVASVPGSPAEGIAVHGHWTVDVRNPDGSLVEHREFDNSLEAQGNERLTSFLARQYTPGRWFVALGGAPGPCTHDSSPSGCVSCEAGDIYASRSNYFSTLTVTTTGTGATAKLVLSGSATIANTTSITMVSATLWSCDATVSPADCAAGSSARIDAANMTYATISPAVPVQAGQQVQVIVEISFN